jgi:hypothetical protein
MSQVLAWQAISHMSLLPLWTSRCFIKFTSVWLQDELYLSFVARAASCAVYKLLDAATSVPSALSAAAATPVQQQ